MRTEIDKSESANQDAPPHFLRVLERSLNVIEAFGAESPEMTLSEMSVRTGLDRATVRRIALSLVNLGYAEKDGKVFRLRPRVLRLGQSFVASLGIAHRAHYVLETLTAETHQMSSLGVLDGLEMVYLARATVPGLEALAAPPGMRIPAHATSLGQVLLAALSPEELDAYFKVAVLERFTEKTVTTEPQLRKLLNKIREQGYAYPVGHFDLTTATIAVPVVKPGGRVIAAMNLYAAGHSENTVMTEFLPKLRHAAALLSEQRTARQSAARQAETASTRKAPGLRSRG